MHSLKGEWRDIPSGSRIVMMPIQLYFAIKSLYMENYCASLLSFYCHDMGNLVFNYWPKVEGICEVYWV